MILWLIKITAKLCELENPKASISKCFLWARYILVQLIWTYEAALHEVHRSGLLFIVISQWFWFSAISDAENSPNLLYKTLQWRCQALNAGRTHQGISLPETWWRGLHLDIPELKISPPPQIISTWNSGSNKNASPKMWKWSVKGQ